MKRIIILLSFLILFAGSEFGQTFSPTRIDTTTTNGWKATDAKADTFYTGFSSIHYDGQTSQIFGFGMSDTSGYVRVEKPLAAPMPRPEAIDFTMYLLNANPRDGNITVGATIYFAHGDTVQRVQNWGTSNNDAPYWQTIGFATEVQMVTLSEVDRIIFEFKFQNYGVPNVVEYSAEYLIDYMRLWYHHPSEPNNPYYPTVIDSFEGKVTGIENVSSQTPKSFTLSQNYPNPFNPSTSIKFQVYQVSKVSLKVYDILGREIATLVDGEKPAGSYTVEFNGSGLASGTYFYRLQTSDGLVETKKMSLVK